jgi:hypothetical protein
MMQQNQYNGSLPSSENTYQQQPTYQETDQYVKQEPVTNQGGYQNL